MPAPSKQAGENNHILKKPKHTEPKPRNDEMKWTVCLMVGISLALAGGLSAQDIRHVGV
jgi:hypothetical protein